MRSLYCPNLWGGLIVYLISLLATLLLASEPGRPWAITLLAAAAVLAVVLWGHQKWIPTFPPHPTTRIGNANRKHLFYLLGVTGALTLVLAADLRYVADPSETFGLAGALWLAGIGSLLCSAFVGSHSVCSDALRPTKWTTWEVVVIAGLVVVALLTRVWDLTHFPDNIYPDEIMTGIVATQAYINPTGRSPSIFSALWSGIDLPALWFWIVALFLKFGGSTLATLRLPAALFGAVTVLPLYGLIRGTWGRSAAIAGAVIMAVSASNVHYSRLALNNIVTQFFWATCFLFVLRGLRSRRPFDWALAGLVAGLSEHFYYGTRLLPFIMFMFFGYILAVHWQQARQYLSSFLLLAGSYFVGFGPLLFHFVRHPNLYFGRGASLLIWSAHTPTSLGDFQSVWKTVWAVLSENLLGISTHSSQDIIFYAPLLLPAEAALLVLGVALLLWQWRHPAAFLMLVSGVSVFLIGGTLVGYPNSVPPLINHWTPAFPAFYVALAIPVGAWMASDELPARLRWVMPVTLATGLFVLGWLNLDFYFHRYYADPESLKSNQYRFSQENYEVQTAQSRYQASLGPEYDVFTVGQSPWPYDPAATRYLVAGQQWSALPNPSAELPAIRLGNKGLAFLFFRGSEQYQQLTYQLHPGGTDGEVTSHRGKHLFYTYVLAPAQVSALHK